MSKEKNINNVLKFFFLSFRNSGSILNISLFGQGNGRIWLKKVDCIISEKDVIGCLQKSDLHNFSHDNDIAIICRRVL